MATLTTVYEFYLPVIGGDIDVWGGFHNDNFEKLDELLSGVQTITPDLANGWKVGGVAVTASAAELNILDGVTASAAEINILDGLTLTTAQLNKLGAAPVQSFADLLGTADRFPYLSALDTYSLTSLNAAGRAYLGGTVSATLAAGTDAQGQGQIPATDRVVVVNSTPNNPSGVTLPALVAGEVGKQLVIFNRGTSSINVYPSSGNSLQVNSTDVPLKLAVGFVMRLEQRSATQWLCSIQPASFDDPGRVLGTNDDGDAVVWVDLPFGVGQTWQNVRASRAINTAYQNTTGRPIQVSISGTGNFGSVQVSEDGSTWIDVGFLGGAGNYSAMNFPIVPNGWYYRQSGGTLATTWAELRE